MELKKHSGHPLVHQKSPNKVNIIKIPEVERGIEYYRENDNVVLLGSGYVNSLKHIDLEGSKNISSFAFTEFFLPNVDSEYMNTKEKRKHIFSIIRQGFKNVSIDERVAQKTYQVFTANNMARLSDNDIRDLYKTDAVGKNDKLTLLLPPFMRESPIPFMINSELKKLGMGFKIITPNGQEIYNVIREKKFDLLYLYTGVTALDPIVELIYLFNHKVTALSYQNKDTLDLLESAKREVNRDKYIALLKSIHLSVLRDYRILPLMHTRMIYSSKGNYQLKELSYFDGSFNLWDWRKM